MGPLVAHRRPLNQGSRLPDPASGQDLGPAATRGPFSVSVFERPSPDPDPDPDKHASHRKLEACYYKYPLL